MKEEKRIQTYQVLVTIASSLIILLLVLAWIYSGPRQEWKMVQSEYTSYMEQLNDSTENNHPFAFSKGLQQYEIAGLNTIDRCITCHLGEEDPRLENAPEPFSYHSGNFIAKHPPEKYGCTICHGGQGRATNSLEAHGIDPEVHWDSPLLFQPHIQSSCGKCHLSIYGDSERLAGTEIFRKGLDIFGREGCIGCHKARGVGGILGPDLSEQGEKRRGEYNFSNITSDESISNWLKEHFRDPETVSPGSRMLKIDLPEEELDALTTFILGLAKPDISFEYFSLPTLNEFKGKRSILKGEKLFSMVCSGCHGKNGEGKSYEEFKTGVPAILGKDFLRVVSDDYIEFTLKSGRSGKQMASWGQEISGIRPEEIADLVKFIHLNENEQAMVYDESLYKNASKNSGQIAFNEYCASCHGENASGGLALALNRADLLKNARNDYLFQTLTQGRKNATMPSWQNLEQDIIYDLLKYIRSWQRFQPSVTNISFTEKDSTQGQLQFLFLCSRCHGENGEGQTGPSIINRDFMEQATDLFLYNTIAFGREHSAMFGWSSDVYNAERLNSEEIGNIIEFMRIESARKPAYIYAGSNPGNKDGGEILYQTHCASCHGKEGEGLKAPALNNQELLSAASNGYITATITIGRAGTDMPAWGYTSEEKPALTGKERQDILAWLRSWQRIRIAN